jgi:glycosyltransferase involved in cell wall biosynthesis
MVTCSDDGIETGGSRMTTPLVSVGMPVYNGERHLREALDSLIAQTHRDFELIVADNASTDGTQAICEEYAARDRRISYFRHTRHTGAIDNFAFVFRRSRGKYFMWAAHDDKEADPRYLEGLLGEMESARGGAEPDLVFPDVSCIDGSGQVILENIMAEFRNCGTRGDYAVASVTKADCQMYGLWRSSALRTIWPFLDQTRNWKSYQDNYFVQVACGRLTVRYVPGVVKLYRSHDGNSCKQSTPWNKFQDYMRFVPRVFWFWAFHSDLSMVSRLRVLRSALYIQTRRTLGLTARFAVGRLVR